jgi:hypothetical protein
MTMTLWVAFYLIPGDLKMTEFLSNDTYRMTS